MQNVSPSFGVPPAQKQGMSPATRSRLVLICLPLLTLALIGVGIYGVQAASQRGLDLGFPTPNVHITSTIQGSVSVGQAVTFTADSPGRDLTYTWNFNDGSPNASGPNVSHTYQSVDENNQFIYTVSVTVVDAVGRKSTDSQTIKVLPLAPVANFTATTGMDSSGYPDVSVDATSSTLTQGVTYTYAWDFGDGGTDNQSGIMATHSYYYTGTYTITLTITDSTGQTSNQATQQVTV